MVACREPKDLRLPSYIPGQLADVLKRGLDLNKHELGTDPGVRPSLCELSQTLRHLQSSFAHFKQANPFEVHASGVLTQPLKAVHGRATQSLGL